MTTTDSTFNSVPRTRPHASKRESYLDAVFDALASDGCRVLLDHLADDGPLTVEDIAARVASDSRGVRARLHHTHLPKLEDLGLVEYDTDCDLVRLHSTPEFEAIQAAVEDAETDLPVSLDTLFDLLANERRRRALQTLFVHGDMSLPDLADEVAVAERHQPLPEIEPDDVLQVYLTLYHTHIQKLVEAGLVTYDQQSDFVEMTDAGRVLEPTVRDLCAVADA